ncbi:hypothetical protein FQN57_004458 [Myotisia sp. PD_48]|nr:hypothetical protein FQN57_004458 [Myotisia sp. PD_48]
MSTVSSPRPSIVSARSPSSSRRPSTETTPRIDSPNPTQRRNRAALRDYYNLRPGRTESSLANPAKATNVAPSQDAPSRPANQIFSTELDKPQFDPEVYVSHLLASSSLATVLRSESSLVSDIKTLDGERKALVYDNYSKLIKAVETIGGMRTTLEEEGTPITMTKTLAPAIGFVTETALGMIREQSDLDSKRQGTTPTEAKIIRGTSDERATVKWVLDTPRRLQQLLNEGNLDEAREDWKDVQHLLSKWGDVRGVHELRESCNKIIGSAE